MKGYDYTMEEIKLVYDYRSKTIHGDYEKATEKLNELSKLGQYQFSKEYLEEEIYLNANQIIEYKIKERFYLILRMVIKCFIFKNDYIKELKESNK